MNEGHEIKSGKTLIDPYGQGLGGFTCAGEQALHVKNVYPIPRYSLLYNKEKKPLKE